VEKGERKGYITERNEEAPENGKESLHSAHASGMNEYTGCPRRNVPDFGIMFLKLEYTDITQNTSIES
jgi:hypothetical protein